MAKLYASGKPVKEGSKQRESTFTGSKSTIEGQRAGAAETAKRVRTSSTGYMPQTAERIKVGKQERQEKQHLRLMKTDPGYAHDYREGLKEETRAKEGDRLSKKTK